MKGWILIIVIVLAIGLGAAEVVRRSMNTAEERAGQTDAIVDHLRGDSWEREGRNAETRATESEEFDQAEEITDSREEELERARGKVRVFIDNVGGN